MKDLDRWMQARAQSIYDWLLDNWNWTKGTTLSILLLSHFVFRTLVYGEGFQDQWSVMPLLGVGLLWHSMQRRRQYKRLNEVSNLFETPVGYAFRFVPVIVVIPYTWGKPLMMCTMFAHMTVLAYLMCVRVRDPEPPESHAFQFQGV